MPQTAKRRRPRRLGARRPAERARRTAAALVEHAEGRVAEGDAPGAAASLRRALELDPTSGRAYAALGLLAERSGNGGAGDPARARAHYDRAVVLAPTDALPYLYRGDLRAREDDLEGALFDLTAAIARSADDAIREVALDARARVLARLGRVEEAAADFEEAWPGRRRGVPSWFGRLRALAG